MGQPWLAVESNFLLIEENGHLSGFCQVVPELPIGRAVLEMGVRSELEGSSVESELFRLSVDRAREMGAKVAHMCLAAPYSRSQLLVDEGFSEVRSYWDMVCRQERLPGLEVPPGFSVRSFQPEDAAILAEAQNASFEGSWGFCPNTVDQMAYRSKMANTSSKGILILSQGDKTAGYCWTCVSPLRDKTKGLIGMIGVVPNYRGRGVSKPILLAAIEYLQSIDVAEIGLQVDGSNTPAIRLYNSVGFEKTGELHWFERKLS